MGFKPEIIRLKSFVEQCGGIYSASGILSVRPSTLTKLFDGKLLSEPTLRKLNSSIERICNLGSSSAFETKITMSSQLEEPDINIIDARSKLGLHPSTVRRISRGKSVSREVINEIKQTFQNSPELQKITIRKTSMVERLHGVYNLYKEKGTLEGVGKVMGLTRERVRQLLVKGTQLGLFEYKPFHYPFIPKEKIIEDYKKFLKLNVVAKRNNISRPYLHKLLTAYNLNENNLHSIRTEGHKLRCIDGYNRIKNELGHHPTTTEMQRSKSWRYLSIKIPRLWGSFDAFRDELNIPKPPQGSHTFKEDMRRWQEHRRRLALIVRMQHLDRIRECLSISGPVPLSQIAFDCNLSIERARRLLGLLMAAKEVIRYGSTSHTKYCLAENRGERWEQ